jgi:hypothetical protein
MQKRIQFNVIYDQIVEISCNNSFKSYFYAITTVNEFYSLFILKLYNNYL